MWKQKVMLPKTAWFQTTHLRNVPYTWARLVPQQYGQGFSLAARKMDTHGQQSPTKNEVEKECCYAWNNNFLYQCKV